MSCEAQAAEPTAGSNAAATPASATTPSVPGDDIFGFTTPTDPGNPGDLAYFNENDGRLGKRDGRYGALNSKFALGYTFAENWWVGGAFFTALNRTVNVAGLPNVNQFSFDGLSVEVLHRVIERGPSNPFAITLSIEPRWGRIDGVTGLGSNSYGATFKLFTDAVVVPDALYWGANLQLNSQTGQDPMNPRIWLPSSQLLTSLSLTYQMATNLFLGAEARYFTLSDTASMRHEIGRALYIGPTLLWKPTEKTALNVTFQPQVYGRSIIAPSRTLDLDDFERAQFRVKLNVNF
jgi:hypothetical protein